MRSFIQAVLKGVAFVVSGCITVVGGLLALVMLLGIYPGGIWLCTVGFDWARTMTAQDPMIGYPIIFLILLALCAWVPVVGLIVGFYATLGTAALVAGLSEAVRKMITREEA